MSAKKEKKSYNAQNEHIREKVLAVIWLRMNNVLPKELITSDGKT